MEPGVLEAHLLHLHVGPHTSVSLEFETADLEALLPVLADVELYNLALLEQGVDDERFIATCTCIPEKANQRKSISCHRTALNQPFLEQLLRWHTDQAYADLPVLHQTLEGRGITEPLQVRDPSKRAKARQE